MANEKRLIDANALFRAINRIRCPQGACMQDGLADACQAVMDAPTVDAVEVVRCKDCKHRGEEGMCPMYWVEEIEWDDDGYTEDDYVPHDYTVDDGFCDRGERRTDNG